MEQLSIYLLKMLVCSAVLYGYYRVALYNERFHQWNRFYLLFTLVVSVVVPFIRIPVMPNAEESNLAALIALMPWNTGENLQKQSGITWQYVLLATVVCVSVIFFLRFLINIAKIVIAYHSSPVSILQHNVKLIITKLTQAPFSFFNWLFWRNDIDPASAYGQRMLNHELTHIYEHHSIDKSFTSLILCVFWINPFFWLIRNELNTIHEFLADRKAVHPKDRVALAEMILQALPFTPPINNGLVNPFFSSQIKRRLLMISTSKKPKYNYLRRISGLAIMVCAVFALALSIRHVEAQETGKVIKENPKKSKMTTSSHNEISVIADTVIYHKKGNEDLIITSPGEKVKLKVDEGSQSPIIIKKDGTLSGVSIISKSGEASINNRKNPPMYILDEKEINAAAMKELDANAIKAINVWKDENAISKYGEKGKNGVIEIKTKTKTKQSISNEKTLIKDNNKTNPFYYINNKEATREEVNKIAPDKIESINVLKGDNAIKKYGEKGKDGVVEISLKKPVT